MFTWLVRLLLAGAAVVTEWFVAPTEARFGVIQGIISLVIFAVVVFALALWHWHKGRA